ncbi:hypothetical protein [Hymenobacter glacieicola]|uniref:Uncharacterized protein n=1 Tax=Hymenobacter glacieicola TaxID=1562124 RepID=A0ABQ1WTF4_9BACT|nr:hypothetical protein [Hymenobacter glacieicola]GGG43076.1 hypothetical protein GCM10011378_19330 [Hymenobacter glacieicola]
MLLSKHLRLHAILLLLPLGMSCSIIKNNETSSADPQIRELEQRVADQKRVAQEAELRAKSEKQELKARELRLKSLKSEAKARQVAAGS